MEAFHVSETFDIQSYKGSYKVLFTDDFHIDTGNSLFLVDGQIATLYQKELKSVLELPSTLLIEANEKNKSLEKFPSYVEHLVTHKLQRHQKLVAIGGGIIQDITAFLAATILRGIEWVYIPTTLLSQADSCIGSKSSINCGNTKNILGTFTPPRQIIINYRFLESLDIISLRSGVGEMLKVHAIAGENEFNKISQDYHCLFHDAELMQHYIIQSLKFKKKIIEIDEFDKNQRLVMNYGHSFGHAIESATEYAIPHGIAVTIGMDMANYYAMHAGFTSENHYSRMHSVFQHNYSDFSNYVIDLEKFTKAISRDKKNINPTSLTLILPNQSGLPQKMVIENNHYFIDTCASYLLHGRIV